MTLAVPSSRSPAAPRSALPVLLVWAFVLALLVMSWPVSYTQLDVYKRQAQHITLKNPRQVNPDPDDMKRIEREMAEQSAANRAYRAGVTPSNLLLDRPVSGGRLSLSLIHIWCV